MFGKKKPNARKLLATHKATKARLFDEMEELANIEEPSPEELKKLNDLKAAYRNLDLDIELASSRIEKDDAEDKAEAKRMAAEKETADWMRVEKYENEAKKLAKILDKHVEQLAPTLINLESVCQKAFNAVPEIDLRMVKENGEVINRRVRKTDGTDMDSSLLGTPKLAGYFKLYLKKNGLDWAATWFDDIRKIRSISENVEDGFGWLMKRRNEPPQADQ